MNRISTGIEGMDEMLGGGFPPKHVVTVAGPPGAGKTIFVLQFTHANLLAGRKCAIFSASHDREMIADYARSFGWDFRPFLQEGKLIVENPEIAEVESGMVSDFLEELPKMVKSCSAAIVSIDSITEFSDLCMSDSERRARLLYLRKVLRKSGATGLLISEVSPDGMTAKYGVVDYISDGLIMLRRISSGVSAVVHAVTILKMTNVEHSREIRAYSITKKGLEVYAKHEVLI